jgi:hypothetical protein
MPNQPVLRNFSLFHPEQSADAGVPLLFFLLKIAISNAFYIICSITTSWSENCILQVGQ